MEEGASVTGEGVEVVGSGAGSPVGAEAGASVTGEGVGSATGEGVGVVGSKAGLTAVSGVQYPQLQKLNSHVLQDVGGAFLRV